MTAVALVTIFAAVLIAATLLYRDTAELLRFGLSGDHPSPRDEGQPAEGKVL
jgi:hypothetical protein